MSVIPFVETKAIVPTNKVSTKVSKEGRYMCSGENYTKTT